MLAHAFPVVAAGTERTRQSLPSWLIGLTCNEVQHLLATLHTRPAGELGPSVALVGLATPTSSPRPVPATTADKPPGSHEDHDLRLEY
jgi:hypothetical protein